jgi:Tfp pilus assembly protein PilO
MSTKTSLVTLLEQQVNRRTARERMLIVLTGAVIIGLLMQWVLFFPQSSAITQLSQEESMLLSQLDATHHELLILQEKLKKGTSNQSKEVQQLQQILVEHNQSLAQFRNQLMSGEKMPQLLERLTQDFAGLKLQNLETFIPKKEDHDPYRHRIKMTLSGEYGQLVNYLKIIEKLPYPISYESLIYTTHNFSQADMVLTIYTLSDQWSWLTI